VDIDEILAPGEARLFCGSDFTVPQSFLLAGGQATVYSKENPAQSSGNEDSAALVATGDDEAVLAVADGMGGAREGARASETAVRCLVDAVQLGLTNDLGLRTGILDGFEQANRAVRALGTGAASTLAVVEISGDTMRPYHVGDSFVLLTGQRGRVYLETIAHSPVGYGVESGLLDAEEAMYHEERHYISNIVGSPEMRIDVGAPRSVAPRDTLVLASDGLSDNLRRSEIVESVRKGSLVAAANRLAQQAAERMNHAEPGRPSKPDDLSFWIFRRVSTPRRVALSA
jgi:serine/threonine protein phosphatase PrpC